MPHLLDHPTDLAAQIAHLIEHDHIAARQVKEHISEARLYELLELDAPVFGDPSDDEYDDDELKDFSTKGMIAELLRRDLSKAEILKMLR